MKKNSFSFRAWIKLKNAPYAQNKSLHESVAVRMKQMFSKIPAWVVPPPRSRCQVSLRRRMRKRPEKPSGGTSRGATSSNVNRKDLWPPLTQEKMKHSFTQRFQTCWLRRAATQHSSLHLRAKTTGNEILFKRAKTKAAAFNETKLWLQSELVR